MKSSSSNISALVLIAISAVLLLGGGGVSCTPVPEDNYQQQYPDVPAQYQYRWAVKDAYSGNDFGQEENRADLRTTGSYFVALPDGRLQKVTYTVDGSGGYVAEVTYEGEAKYPETQPPPRPAAYPAAVA